MIGDLFLSFALLGAEWVLWLLLLLSVLSVAVVFDRWRFYRSRQVDTDELCRAARTAVAEGRELERDDSPAMEVAVARAGVKAASGGADQAGEAMNQAKARARRDYEARAAILGTLGNNAPFIGLFGTVLGIVGAFNKLKENPEGGIDVVGGDLSEALVATAIGILVAVPAVIAFNLFGRMLRRSLSSTDEVAHAVLAATHARGSRAAGSATGEDE